MHVIAWLGLPVTPQKLPHMVKSVLINLFLNYTHCLVEILGIPELVQWKYMGTVWNIKGLKVKYFFPIKINSFRSTEHLLCVYCKKLHHWIQFVCSSCAQEWDFDSLHIVVYRRGAIVARLIANNNCFSSSLFLSYCNWQNEMPRCPIYNAHSRGLMTFKRKQPDK